MTLAPAMDAEVRSLARQLAVDKRSEKGMKGLWPALGVAMVEAYTQLAVGFALTWILVFELTDRRIGMLNDSLLGATLMLTIFGVGYFGTGRLIRAVRGQPDQSRVDCWWH